MKAVFVSQQTINNTITSFTFEPTRPFAYTAGQYINLALPGHHEHGATAERWFTLSSSPHEALVTITTRITHIGQSTFKRALAGLQPGDIVEISEPLGAFVLPRLTQTPLVWIAGGIGITPFHSMASWIHHHKEFRQIRMLHSVKTEEDIIFQDVFEKAKIHTTVVVAQASAAWGGERGNLTAEMVVGIEEPSDDTLFYISGPEPFVQNLQSNLEGMGVSNQRIVVDEFQGYSEL